MSYPSYVNPNYHQQPFNSWAGKRDGEEVGDLEDYFALQSYLKNLK